MNHLKTIAYIVVICTMFYLWIRGMGLIMLVIMVYTQHELTRWAILIPSVLIYAAMGVRVMAKFLLWFVKLIKL
jgi:hypothetical protein